MSRRIAALVLMGIACGIASAYGQEPTAGPAFVEVTYMPAWSSREAICLGRTLVRAIPRTGDAPEFFGRDNRYAHRVYGGVIINTVR